MESARQITSALGAIASYAESMAVAWSAASAKRVTRWSLGDSDRVGGFQCAFDSGFDSETALI